jgi:hypothetical protein
MTSRNDKLFRRARGAAIAAAVVAVAGWALGTVVVRAPGEWIVVSLAVVLATLIAGDALHRMWLAARGRRA